MFRAVYGRAGLDRYALQAVPSIHIIAKNGHVVLEGVVKSKADKNLAGVQAKGARRLLREEQPARGKMNGISVRNRPGAGLLDLERRQAAQQAAGDSFAIV